MRRSALLMVGCLALAPAARAQDPAATAAVPAAVALSLRQTLALSDSQAAKLRDIEKQQTVAFDRTLAAFLRVEADVVASMQNDDPVARRGALERRSKVAIDAEVARMKWEKDVRAVLTGKQLASYGEWAAMLNPRDGTPVLWQSLVEPIDLRASIEQRVDSGEVRISVVPNYGDIYLNGEKRGSGRKVLLLPVGKYEVKFHAVGCTEAVQSIDVVKGPPMIVTQRLTCSK